MKKKRPSAPMVLSIIAVVFSLAGTGVASVATISALNKKEKKQTRNIADSEITKKAPGLSVANADNVGGLPLRTAAVNANGTVDAARSFGVTSANVTAKGVPAAIYCFNGLNPAPRSVVASVDGSKPTYRLKPSTPRQEGCAPAASSMSQPSLAATASSRRHSPCSSTDPGGVDASLRVNPEVRLSIADRRFGRKAAICFAWKAAV